MKFYEREFLEMQLDQLKSKIESEKDPDRKLDLQDQHERLTLKNFKLDLIDIPFATIKKEVKDIVKPYKNKGPFFVDLFATPFFAVAYVGASVILGLIALSHLLRFPFGDKNYRDYQ